MRPILAFAALGVGGYAAFKLLGVVLPLLGLAVGLVVLVIKLLLVLALIWIAYRILRKVSRPVLRVE